MLILMLCLFMGLVITGIIVYCNSSGDGGIACMSTGSFLSLIVAIVLIVGGVTISESKVIDKKIEMFQEENTVIETNITTSVEKYLEHEYGIYDSLQGENIEVLLVAYPQIKSDTLVEKQLDVFISNNNKIRELKEQKLNIEVWRFWVYFG